MVCELPPALPCVPAPRETRPPLVWALGERTGTAGAFTAAAVFTVTAAFTGSDDAPEDDCADPSTSVGPSALMLVLLLLLLVVGSPPWLALVQAPPPVPRSMEATERAATGVKSQQDMPKRVTMPPLGSILSATQTSDSGVRRAGSGTCFEAIVVSSPTRPPTQFRR